MTGRETSTHRPDADNVVDDLVDRVSGELSASDFEAQSDVDDTSTTWKSDAKVWMRSSTYETVSKCYGKTADKGLHIPFAAYHFEISGNKELLNVLLEFPLLIVLAKQGNGVSRPCRLAQG